MASDEKNGSHAATPISVSAGDRHGKQKQKRSNSPLDPTKKKVNSISPSSVALRSRSGSVCSIVSSKDWSHSRSRSYHRSTRGWRSCDCCSRSRSLCCCSHPHRHSYSHQHSSEHGYRCWERDRLYYYYDYDRYSCSHCSRDRESSYYRASGLMITIIIRVAMATMNMRMRGFPGIDILTIVMILIVIVLMILVMIIWFALPRMVMIIFILGLVVTLRQKIILQKIQFRMKKRVRLCYWIWTPVYR